MMVKVTLSPEAKRDLLQIGDYIAFTLHNRTAARKTIGRLRNTMGILEKIRNPVHYLIMRSRIFCIAIW